MMSVVTKAQNRLKRFIRADDGSSTVEFVLWFPFFMLMFLNSFEVGTYTLRQAMLERGVDLTVRAVRIGELKDPTHRTLKEEICNRTMLIPNCADNLQLQMVREEPRNWVGRLQNSLQCIDRALDVQPAVQFTNGGNNELMILQVCVLYDPKMPTLGIGQRLADNPNGAYALIATSAFVMEPYK